MNKIIITVTDAVKSGFYDVEIPVKIYADKLKHDIADTLNAFDPCLRLDERNMKLYCNRTRRVLALDETAESAGVRNGDYITVTGRF